MNESATSLDRLHDIVVPPPVPIWPPAPGWYAVILIVIGLLCVWTVHLWTRWKTNAYRRAAIKELTVLDSCAQISELLRRVALAISSRNEIAVQTGEDWPEWLAIRCRVPMPPQVRNQLASGLYRDAQSTSDIQQLKTYAAAWISQHQIESSSARKTPAKPMN